jgi:hypothetical protein
VNSGRDTGVIGERTGCQTVLAGVTGCPQCLQPNGEFPVSAGPCEQAPWSMRDQSTLICTDLVDQCARAGPDPDVLPRA